MGASTSRRASKPKPMASLRPWPCDEQWRAVRGFDGYEVSDKGRVRSWRVSGHDGARSVFPKLISQRFANGYLRVTMQVSSQKSAVRYVHSLVLEAFVLDRPKGLQCRHLDGNRENNAVENLAWGTAIENALDKELHGTVARGERHGWHTNPHLIPRGDRHGSRTCPDRVPRGVAHGRSKLTDDAVREMRALHASGVSYSKLALRFSLTKGNVGKVIRGEQWAHVA